MVPAVGVDQFGKLLDYMVVQHRLLQFCTEKYFSWHYNIIMHLKPAVDSQIAAWRYDMAETVLCLSGILGRPAWPSF